MSVLRSGKRRRKVNAGARSALAKQGFTYSGKGRKLRTKKYRRKHKG